MKFGILFTSHPDPEAEPYPHRDVHARVTREVEAADRLGFDHAWIAEHHFSNTYGILPDPFAYCGYLAARTTRIMLGPAVMTLPLYHPVRVVENAALIDILSDGRFQLGLGSGYRPYEFEGFGVDFEARRDIQEEALDLVLDAFHRRRFAHDGRHFKAEVGNDYEILPVSRQQPHPPLYLAGGSERSIAAAARRGFGLMLSTLPDFEATAASVAIYRAHMAEAPAPLDRNPVFGHVDVARWVYVAETDAKAKADSEAGIIHHLSHFLGRQTAGYLGRISDKERDQDLDYDHLAETTLIHGSPETVIARIRALKAATGATSMMLHYPPYYGPDKTLAMLELFAAAVMPELAGDETPLAAAE